MHRGHDAGSWRCGLPLPRVTFSLRPWPGKRAVRNEDEIIAAIKCAFRTSQERRSLLITEMTPFIACMQQLQMFAPLLPWSQVS